MPDFVRLNGTSVRITGFFIRKIERPDGPPLDEVELVFILRGAMAHRSFVTLLARNPVRLDIPTGESWSTLETEVANAVHATSGAGEAAVHRHDVTLRETPASADRRAAVTAAHHAAVAAEAGPAARPAPIPAPEDDDVDASNDLSNVKMSGNAVAWATALRQMTSPDGPKSKPASSEPPLEPVALAGVEAVLVGLRLEALIEQLDAAGVLRRPAVEDAFRRLVAGRFVAEATPVVGAPAAKRAARGLLESH